MLFAATFWTRANRGFSEARSVGRVFSFFRIPGPAVMVRLMGTETSVKAPLISEKAWCGYHGVIARHNAAVPGWNCESEAEID